MIIPGIHGNGASGNDIEDQTERLDLGSHPAKIGNDDTKGNDNLDGATVTILVIIADRHQVHPVQTFCKNETDDDQAHGRTERIGNDPYKPFLNECGRNAENRFRTEPGGKNHCCYNGHGQGTPRNGKIF